MLKAFIICLGHLTGVFNLSLFLNRMQACGWAVSLSEWSFWIFSLFLVLLQPISNADFIVPVEIDGTVHQVILHRYGELPEMGLNKTMCEFIRVETLASLYFPLYLLFPFISQRFKLKLFSCLWFILWILAAVKITGQWRECFGA